MADTIQTPTTNSLGDQMEDHAEALAALAVAAFTRAVKAAVAENDRLGVPSYGCDERGQITVRQPAAERASATPG